MLTTLAPSSGEKHNQTCPYPCLRALLLRRLRRRIGSNLTPAHSRDASSVASSRVLLGAAAGMSLRISSTWHRAQCS
jgi:hypothetical protein